MRRGGAMVRFTTVLVVGVVSPMGRRSIEHNSVKRNILKGWSLSAKLGKHSAIWGKLGTALQAYTLNPCTKFPPNPTSRKANNLRVNFSALLEQ